VKRRRRAGSKRVMVKTAPINNHTRRLVAIRRLHAAIAIVMAKPITRKHSTRAADAVRSILAKSRTDVVDLTASNKQSRPPAIVALVGMSVVRNVAYSMAMSGALRRRVKASTGQESTTPSRKNAAVRVNTGVALALVNTGKGIVTRRVAADRPSAKLEATRRAMAKKSPMAVRSLPGMNAKNMVVNLEATAVSNHNTVLTLIALEDMVVRRNQATVVRVPADTVVRKAWNMEVSDQTNLMALLGSLEGLVMSLRAMVAAATTKMNMARGGKSMVQVDTGDGTRHTVLCRSLARTCLVCFEQAR